MSFSVNHEENRVIGLIDSKRAKAAKLLEQRLNPGVKRRADAVAVGKAAWQAQLALAGLAPAKVGSHPPPAKRPPAGDQGSTKGKPGKGRQRPEEAWKGRHGARHHSPGYYDRTAPPRREK